MSYEQNIDFIKTRFFDFFKIWFYDEKSIPKHKKRVPGPAQTLPDHEKLRKHEKYKKIHNFIFFGSRLNFPWKRT